MPTPQDDEASTQNSTGDNGVGLDNVDLQKSEESWVLHHCILVRTLGFGVFRIKGDDKKLKDDAKRDKDGRCERPSGSANEQ